MYEKKMQNRMDPVQQDIEAKQCISNLDAERFSRTEEVVVQLIIAIWCLVFDENESV